MAAATATKRATRPAAKKASSAKPKSDGTTVDTPKLSKREKDAVAKAIRLGLDVEPERFDMDALTAAMKIAEQADAIAEETPVGIQGTDGKVFERGLMLGRRGDAVRLKNDLGTVEIPVHMIGKFVAFNEQQQDKPKTSRAARPASTSEPRPPREGSGLWAALEVLKKARTPMTGADVFAKIKERKLAPNLKGKTPEATITAALNVAAARGQHGVVRPEPGRFAIQKGDK